MNAWLTVAVLALIFFGKPLGELFLRAVDILEYISKRRPRSKAGVQRRERKDRERQRLERQQREWRERASRPSPYDDHHRAVALQWAKIIAREAAECMEKVCVMPTRHIAAGSPRDSWHLAHDHVKGGHRGPAHAQCNQAEALYRGATWPGAPTLAVLLRSVGYRGIYPNGYNGPERPVPPKVESPTPVEPPRPMTKEDPWGGLDPWG